MPLQFKKILSRPNIWYIAPHIPCLLNFFTYSGQNCYLSFLLNGISFVVRGGGGRRFLCTYSTVVQICCTCADVQ